MIQIVTSVTALEEQTFIKKKIKKKQQKKTTQLNEFESKYEFGFWVSISNQK